MASMCSVSGCVFDVALLQTKMNKEKQTHEQQKQQRTQTHKKNHTQQNTTNKKNTNILITTKKTTMHETQHIYNNEIHQNKIMNTTKIITTTQTQHINSNKKQQQQATQPQNTPNTNNI